MIDRFMGLNAPPQPVPELTLEQLQSAKFRKCWDCGTYTDDYVVEKRQTSGPGHNDGPQLYAGDFTDVTVHANRRDCEQASRKKVEDWKRAHIPFYDIAKDWKEPVAHA